MFAVEYIVAIAGISKPCESPCALSGVVNKVLLVIRALTPPSKSGKAYQRRRESGNRDLPCFGDRATAPPMIHPTSESGSFDPLIGTMFEQPTCSLDIE